MTQALSAAAMAPTEPNKPVGEGLHSVANDVYRAADLLVTAGCYSQQPILRDQAVEARSRAVLSLRAALAQLDAAA